MNAIQNITELPEEVIVHVSKYLNIQDKLKLRLINKKFKFIFDNLIKLNRSTITSNELMLNSNWFYTNKSNKEIDLIKINDLNILNDLFKKNLFFNIKNLFFYFDKIINLDNTINQFKNLEELNIFCILTPNSILLLPKLRILSINQIKSGNKLEIVAPSLSYLRCENLKYYQLNYPKKIIYLDINQQKNDFNITSSSQIEKFKKLEIYISNDYLYEITQDLLIKLNCLKEIHINEVSLKRLFPDRPQKIKEIYEYKLKMKLDNLKIFLYGIDYEYLKELNEDQISAHQLNLIFQYYSKTIDILPFINYMYFDCLYLFLDNNPNIILDNIIHKFPNISIIYADLNEKNIDRFKFLYKFHNLSELDLTIKNQISDPINYLNLLPDLIKRIKYLTIENLKINEFTNLDFLYKFTNIKELNLGKLNDLNILKYFPNDLNYYIKCKYNRNIEITYYEGYYQSNNNNILMPLKSRKFDKIDEFIKEINFMIDSENEAMNDFDFFGE